MSVIELLGVDAKEFHDIDSAIARVVRDLGSECHVRAILDIVVRKACERDVVRTLLAQHQREIRMCRVDRCGPLQGIGIGVVHALGEPDDLAVREPGDHPFAKLLMCRPTVTEVAPALQENGACAYSSPGQRIVVSVQVRDVLDADP